MALRDWLTDSGPAAVATIAVFAAEDPKSELKTAITAKTATATPQNDDISIANHQSADLPEGCPLATGVRVPAMCRFEARFFRRMLDEGVLNVGGPCPIRHVCRRERS